MTATEPRGAPYRRLVWAFVAWPAVLAAWLPFAFTPARLMRIAYEVFGWALLPVALAELLLVWREQAVLARDRELGRRWFLVLALAVLLTVGFRSWIGLGAIVVAEVLLLRWRRWARRATALGLVEDMHEPIA
ncbi:MAG: hypothetical protein ACTHMS_15895 [Jatrophihabitans sp.]|uniref:hypothetical protein n=1 Tax=Jatrophihabitans sp. TaxID=1932789 RepID=UPI003F7F1B97